MTWKFESTAWPKPATLASLITCQPHSFWLDSDAMAHPHAKLSIVGVEPEIIFDTKQKLAKLEKHLSSGANPLPLPFAGGALGFITYEAKFYFVCHRLYWVYDHSRKKSYLLYQNKDAKLKQQWLKKIKKLISPVTAVKNPFALSSLRSNFSRKTYQQTIQEIIHRIHRGDCYQVNLSQQFKIPFQKNIGEFYLQLRTVSPAPYMAFINTGTEIILSNSPECFLKIQGREIISRPIKGTRPRGQTKKQDLQLKTELFKSQKDAAELLMITDLMRNDLGKISTPGSVKVPSLKKVETFSNVHHLVATVTATLASNITPLQAFLSASPAGSITGAPKLKAMEIIRELEPNPRGIYTGSIGYIDFRGNAAFNVAIRTALFKNNQLYFNSGGGIVADSDPASEYEETLYKAKNFLKLLLLRRT
ncbi:MAG: aminodeoxychorismate synthase component I [Deltaproteobacteria bacterium]|nr:aminodeoxychorismate synthase component I [Deltaproteobacteria bacterium]